MYPPLCCHDEFLSLSEMMRGELLLFILCVSSRKIPRGKVSDNTFIIVFFYRVRINSELCLKILKIIFLFFYSKHYAQKKILLYEGVKWCPTWKPGVLEFTFEADERYLHAHQIYCQTSSRMRS